MTLFKGITEEYRRSEEYKGWFKAIKADYPNMPDYLIEMSISAHKLDPQYYKKAAKEEQKIIKEKFDRSLIEDYDAIKVYNSVDDIPPNKDDNLPTVEIILDKNKQGKNLNTLLD